MTRSWYDLLGRTLLVAENWKDFGANNGPVQAGGSGPSNLTPSHTGPIRYTANHYTRGGLLDMKVAVIPSDPAAAFNLVPAGFGSGAAGAVEIAWTESGAEGDFTATAVDIAGAAVQATRYVYNADVVNESKDAGGERDVVSTATNRVAQVWYPKASESDPGVSGDAGQPDSGNALKYKYTLDGQIARREDQRGVMIDFLYGTCEGCGGGYWPGAQLTRVDVIYPDNPPALGAVAENVDHLSYRYNERGQLSGARSYGPPGSVGLLNESRYTYGSFGMLASETLDPTGDSTYAKTVQYHREWVARGNPAGKFNRQAQRLVGMTYPLADVNDPVDLRVNFLYDSDSGGGSEDVDDQIHRITTIEQIKDNEYLGQVLQMPVLTYARTGAGRVVNKRWGGTLPSISSYSQLDLTAAGALDRFGRLTSLQFTDYSSFIQRYDYGYDADGNRTFAKIVQAGHDNDRSFLYGYDELNRLVSAGLGMIDVAGGVASLNTSSSVTPAVTLWQLDALGNWSGGPAGSYVSVRNFQDENGNLTQDAGEDNNWTDHHQTDADNRIGTRNRREYENGSLAVTNDFGFAYDDAGNLLFDGEKLFTYDAFNRLVAVYNNDDAGDPLHIDGSGNLAGTPGSVIATYGYDARGRWISRKVGTDGSEYLYYDGARDIEHYKENGTGALTLTAQYVYGTEYVDELAGVIDAAGVAQAPDMMYFLRQDANYNVIGVTDYSGIHWHQFSYSPYGQRVAAEAASVTFQSADPLVPEEMLTQKGFQGLTHLPEIDGVQNRNRILAPPLGRFLQGDQNGTGLIVLSSLGFHGSEPQVSVAVDPPIQYADGLNIFDAHRNNPNNNSDPNGLFTYIDTLISAGIAGGLAGAAYSYSNFLDFDSKTGTQSNWRIAAAFAHGAGMGVGTALGFGWLSGAVASYAGVSIGTAATSIGLMTSPAIFGLAVNEYESAETYQERLWAKINLAGAGLAVITPHIAMFKVVSSGGLAGARPFKGNLRTFTKSNFRHNLKVRTGIDPGSRVHAHHVLPKELARDFTARGINVHDPRYGAWWPEHDHLSEHRHGYNQRWREFFRTNPTAAQLEQFGRDLAREYGFEIGF